MTDQNNDDVATTFKLVTTMTDEGPEEWRVRIVGWPEDSEPDEDDVLVDSVVYRALIDQNWFERFDSVDQDLASIAEDLLDRDLLELVDEESAYANAIIVVDSVDERQDVRGRGLDHEVVRALSRVFGTDIIALRPGEVSITDDAVPFDDTFIRRRQIRHWQDMGFVPIPGRETVILPLSARLAEIQG